MRIINVNVKRDVYIFAVIFQDKSVNESKINEKSDEKIKSESKFEKFECVCDKKHSF